MNSKTTILDEVIAFISGKSDRSFNEIALRVVHHQNKKLSPYQKFLQNQVGGVAAVNHWSEIPAVPTLAFKLPVHPLCDEKSIEVTFLTSGTSREIRGAHHFPSTALYRTAIDSGWDFAGLPRDSFFFLSPPPAESPQSSLVFMFNHLGQNEADRFLMHDSKFLLAPIFCAIEKGQPIFLMGTALAFLHLMKNLGPLELPQGSRLLETGGYKGMSQTLAKPDFYAQLNYFFGVPDHLIHNEYGMTELSSQAYASGTHGVHRFPPWCRVIIRDPETAQEVEVGETGYLTIYDLANLHSVIGISTQDFAIRHRDGSFTLLGRDPAALPRGCSRTIDQSLST